MDWGKSRVKLTVAVFVSCAKVKEAKSTQLKRSQGSRAFHPE
jgi:hypothetical protein